MTTSRKVAPHKCALEGCDIITSNPMYCCAAHRQEANEKMWAQRLAGTRVCPCCGKEKPSKDFYTKRCDGLLQPREVCQECIDTGLFRSWKSKKAAKSRKGGAVAHTLSGYLLTVDGWGGVRLGDPCFPVPGNSTSAAPFAA